MKTLVKISAVLILFSLGSCSFKAYNQRTSGINGSSGIHTAFKTQKQYNFEAAMKRTDPNYFYVFGMKLPKVGKK